MLLFLMLVLVFNNVDRQLIGLVLQDIKLDLGLSDTQLGLLTGIAFALFYSVMGIPIARWADKGNRKTIISVTTALWSVMLIMCGYAANFTQLLLARIGVAVGEAGCLPPANSLIAEYFSRAERPQAMAFYLQGMTLSTIIGYFAGGWLTEFYGWRTAFVILALPGLVLALLAHLTLREPRLSSNRLAEGGRPQKSEPAEALLPLIAVFKILWGKKTFRHLITAYAIQKFFSLGVATWLAAFFIRSHGMQTGEIGTWFAVIWGGFGSLGLFLGGYLASRYAVHRESFQLKVIAGIFVVMTSLNIVAYLADDKYVALGLIALSSFISLMVYGPLWGIIQSVVQDRIRATAVATIYLVANLIGMGLGPFIMGILSDVLMPKFGQESLRYALIAFAPGYYWLAVHLYFASKTVADDIEIETDMRGAATTDIPLTEPFAVKPGAAFNEKEA